MKIFITLLFMNAMLLLLIQTQNIFRDETCHWKNNQQNVRRMARYLFERAKTATHYDRKCGVYTQLQASLLIQQKSKLTSQQLKIKVPPML
ncbi:MAG: hypothetical protein JNM93_13905 [Bacteriovoracaceae bacterium]|nr:hypothetical protein [Bacteriovoracaceae bacterium]